MENKFIEIRNNLEDLIEKVIKSDKTKNYLNILKKENTFLPKEIIDKYEEEFILNLKKIVPDKEYEEICGGRKENRRYIYNSLVIISRIEREKINSDRKPIFSNFTESLDYVVNRFNKGKYTKFPFSAILILENRVYEIPLIRIPEAYFLLIINKDNPVKKEPPIRGSNFINEFEIEINSYPKSNFNRVFIEGYRDIGEFNIFSDSIFDKIHRMRKVKYRDKIFFPNIIGREPLQALYILNLLENRKNNYGFKIIVPDPSLIKIISGIYKSIVLYTENKLPIIFTYLILNAEIERRREIGLNSFYITHYINDKKLEILYSKLHKDVKYIENKTPRNIFMKTVAF